MEKDLIFEGFVQYVIREADDVTDLCNAMIAVDEEKATAKEVMQKVLAFANARAELIHETKDLLKRIHDAAQKPDSKLMDVLRGKVGV